MFLPRPIASVVVVVLLLGLTCLASVSAQQNSPPSLPRRPNPAGVPGRRPLLPPPPRPAPADPDSDPAAVPAAVASPDAGAMPAPPPDLSGLPAAPLPATPSAPGANGGAEPADVHLQFAGADVIDVLTRYYAPLIGKHVLIDPTVQSNNINVDVPMMVTKSDAIAIIETILALNGFAIVPVSANIVKVMGQGKKVTKEGVPIYSDLAQVPATEQSVTFLLRLRYLDAQELSNQLNQYSNAQQDSTRGMVALQKSGALLITDTGNNIRRIVNMINQLDVPVAPVTEKFIRLERADATKAVEFLNGVFETKSAGASGVAGPIGAPGVPNARRPIRRLNDEGQPVPDPGQPLLPGQLPLLSGDSIIQGRITLTADIRTNRVHVVTSPFNMPLVEQLIKDYDADSPFAEPVVRPLHFIKAKVVLPILVQSLTEPGAEGSNSANAGANPATPNRPTSQQTSVRNNFSSNESDSGSGSGSGSTVGNEELSVEPADVVPQIEIVGNTKIIADPSSNRIILLGGAEARDKVFKVLDTLDVPTRQIIIRVVIGELALGNNSEFGLQYLLRRNKSVLASQYSSGFINNGSTTTTTDPTTGATTGTTTSGTTSTLSDLAALASGLPTGFSGLAGIISVTKNFDIILSALEATNRFKTINRPVLFTSNAQKATIINGTEIAVPTSTLSTASIGTTTANGASISSNVEFKKVALQLEVLPLINSDREVTLDIVQKLDSLVPGQNVQVGGNSIPTIANRELKSTVSMQSGATVILGGLITVNDDKTNSNVPILSRIPVVGELFKARTHDLNRSELIVLIHPEVVNTPGQIAAATAAEQNRTYLGTGLEDSLLPTFPVRKAMPVTKTTITTTTATTTVRRAPTPTPAPK